MPDLMQFESNKHPGHILKKYGITLSGNSVSLPMGIQHFDIIKRPARDACLYLGERGERVGPPAPAFSIAYSSATTG